jgi:hypothetical protein
MFQSSLLYIQAGVLYQTLLISNLLQGLRLFNLDIIREHGTRDRFYVIDINYFPGKFDFHTFFAIDYHKHVV